jgi:predicted aminopeptidase
MESSFKINVLDTNFYKEKELSQEDIEIIKNFSKSLKISNFIEKPKELPEKPSYKLFITFKKEKYIINVYNEKYLSVYPWDGIYPMDYIDMEGIQAHYNLFSLCKYLMEK